MDERAYRWGRTKTAGFFGGGFPHRSEIPQLQRETQVDDLMTTHFPRSYGREIIMTSPNLSFGDRVRLLGAVDTSAQATSPSANLVQMSKFLPAAVGAGLGLMGAALTAPIFGFTPLQKKMYGIGAGALGAVLNTYGRD